MCLNPTIILNPAYSQHRHEFSGISLNGTFIAQEEIGRGVYYPVNLPSFVSLGLSADNLANFFAVDPDGQITKIFMPVPCNKCLECMESKQSAIRVRMLLEQMSHDCPPLFVTLTYNNENLPSDGVSKTDVRRFLNRLHLYLGRAGFPTYFRHVFFSEYGSLNKRPHYHGILYGIDWLTEDLRWQFFEILEKAWGKGIVRYDIVSGRAFKYVSKYVGKDILTGDCEGRNPNFWTASRRDGGLGSQICNDESFLELCSTPHFPTVMLPVEDRVFEVTLPGYIRDKILPPLSKYITKEVRRAYLELKKDYILAFFATETLFAAYDHIPFDLLPKEFADKPWMGFSLSRYCTLSDFATSIESRLDLDKEFRALLHTSFFKIVEQYDTLLGHLHGSDEYWCRQIREVPKDLDFVALKTRIFRNYEILVEHLPDIPFILTQLHARRRVSDRFAARVEKFQSELPPSDQREVLLRHRNSKLYAERVKDCQ